MQNDKVWSYQGYELDKGNLTTALVHLYRAEVTRVNLWRNRLDTTTNWAVVTTAGALTFAFSSAQNPHFLLLLVLLLALLFLSIEARRYRYYSLWYHRARLLETDFFAAMFAPPFQPAPDWGDTLNDLLRNPTFPISRWEALGNRYRRTYLAIVSIIVLSWFLKLAVHPIPTRSLQELVTRATIGAITGDGGIIPGPIVIASVVGVYGVLGLLTIVGYARFKLRGPQSYSTRAQYDQQHARNHIAPNLATIITNHKAAVAQRLMEELGRGVTAIEGTGMYTGETRDVLLCAVTDVQVRHLQNIVHAIDENGFVIVTQANDVRGGHFRAQGPPS